MSDSPSTPTSRSFSSSDEGGGYPPLGPEAVPAVIARFRSGIADFLERDNAYPCWRPSKTYEDVPSWNTENRQRLKGLQIPRLYTYKGDPPVPDIPLHHLGSLEDLDPGFRDRIADFMSGNEHILLVNVSGAGKSRMVYETLTRSWGLYFSCAVDLTANPYGSDDLCQAFQSLEFISFGGKQLVEQLVIPCKSPGDVERLASNRLVARQVFRRLLLSRLLFFELFHNLFTDNKACTQSQAQYKWILLQLRPEVILGRDIFSMMTRVLRSVPDADVDTQLSRLEGALGGLLNFIAVDEAQVANGKLGRAFASGDGTVFAPILRELALNLHAGCPRARLILSGTEVDRHFVSDALLYSCQAQPKKVDGLRFYYDLGQFDSLTRTHAYLRHFFGDSLSPPQCAEIFRWLRGRHRFLTVFVYHLLLTGPTRVDAVLDMLVSCLCGHERRVDDDDDYIDETPYSLIMQDSFLESFRLARLLRDALFTFALRHEPTTFSHPEHGPRLVAVGLAIFTDGKGAATVSEPLVFYRLLAWLQKSEHHTIARVISQRLHDDTVIARGTSFAAGVAACLWNVLSGSGARLADLLRFEGPDAPCWSADEAAIVLPPSARRLRGNAASRSAAHDAHLSYSIAGAQSPSEVLRWLSGGKHAFLVPDRGLDADLLFFLRVKSAGIVLVFLHLEPYIAERPRRTRTIVPPDPSRFYPKSRADRDRFLTALKVLPAIHFDRQRARPLKFSMLHVICFTRAYREDYQYNPPVACLDIRRILEKGHARELEFSHLDIASLETAV